MADDSGDLARLLLSTSSSTPIGMKQKHALGYADSFAAELAIERGAPGSSRPDPEFQKVGKALYIRCRGMRNSAGLPGAGPSITPIAVLDLAQLFPPRAENSSKLPARLSPERTKIMSFAKLTQAVLLLLVGSTLVPSGWAQTYTVLYTFEGGTDGAYPFAGLIRDSAGNLYGSTIGANVGGLEGSVFKLSLGKFKLLHSFKYGGAGGARPGGLVRDSAGNLYGTTAGWGTSPATIFKLTKYGVFSVLHTFTGGAGGSSPLGPLVLDPAGNLYGATGSGGSPTCGGGFGCGVVFKLDTSGNETVLHTFLWGKRGTYPNGGLIRDAAGNLYGTTSSGGYNLHGTVFKLDPAGNETVLYAFKGEPDGSQPNGELIQDAAGNFYGTTLWGGTGKCQSRNCGVVFKLDTNGNETLLHSFSGGADGGNPVAGLVMDSARNLYGTTVTGGAPGCLYYACGVVFKLDQSGKETVLYTFVPGGTTGFSPEAGVIRDSAGNLYGTASLGGDVPDCQVGGCGVVFKITP